MNFLKNIEPEIIDMKDVYEEKDVVKQLDLEAKKLLKRKQQNQMHDMRDTQYYVVLVFGNKSDKNQFLTQINNSIEVEGETFINGYEFAKSLKIDIQCSAKLPEPHYIQQIKVKKNGNTISRKR